MSEKTRVRVIVCATLLSALVSAVLAILYFTSWGYITSWGQKIQHGESYLEIENETLTQKDLEYISKLRGLRSLRIENCNVAECRLPELRFVSRRLYRVSFAGTEGLWDLSFLRSLKVSELDLSDCPGVSDLSTVNWDELSYLHVDGTEVTDLSPVAKSDLSGISFARTDVSDVSPLASVDFLSDIDGSYTKVSSLDALAGKQHLWRICFDGCPIERVDQPFAASYLREVSLAHTPVSSLAGLSACERIDTLNLAGCAQMTSMDWLNKQCRETLTDLNLAGTSFSVQDLAWIGSCEELEHLTLDTVKMEDLTVCERLGHLQTLSAVGCGLTSLKGIEQCGELHTMLLGYNHVSSLEGLPGPQDEWPRTVLDLSHNQLDSLSGLKAGAYHAILLHGNGADVGRSIPAEVGVDELVVSWFPGIEDSRLQNYGKISHIYLLDCPPDKVEAIDEAFYAHRLTRVSETELWELLLEDNLYYWLNVDYSGYVAYAKGAAA